MSDREETLLITVEIMPSKTDDGWFLEVVHSITGKVYNCQTLEEMNENIETLYGLYPSRELQVMWLPSLDAAPEHIEDVRVKVGVMQKEIDENKT